MHSCWVTLGSYTILPVCLLLCSLCKNKGVLWPQLCQMLGPTQLSSGHSLTDSCPIPSVPVWAVLPQSDSLPAARQMLPGFTLAPNSGAPSDLWYGPDKGKKKKKKKTKVPLYSKDRKSELLQMESFPCPFLYTIKVSSVSLLPGKSKNVEHHPLTENTLRRTPSLDFAECSDTFLIIMMSSPPSSVTSLSIPTFLKYVKSKGDFSNSYSRRPETSMASSKIFSNLKITLMSRVCFEASIFLFSVKENLMKCFIVARRRPSVNSVVYFYFISSQTWNIKFFHNSRQSSNAHCWDLLPNWDWHHWNL